MLPLVLGVTAISSALKSIGLAVATTVATTVAAETTRRYVINYGGNCNDGSHDHRTNRGRDRTPSQREGDRKRRRIISI